MSATLSAGIDSLVLKINNPLEQDGVTPRDDLISTKVWYSTVNNFVPPGQGTLAYDGPGLDISITGLISGTTYYVRYALISEIQPDYFILSSLLVATPVYETQTTDATPPPTPTGVVVTAGVGTVFIKHDNPVYTQGRGHNKTHVFGLKESPAQAALGYTFANAAAAGEIAQFTGNVFNYSSDPATTWHIWLKWESNNGILSTVASGGAAGSVVTTAQDVSLLLDALSGEITESQLFSSLGDRIDLIDGPIAMAGSVAAKVYTEEQARLAADTSLGSSITTLQQSDALQAVSITSLQTRATASESNITNLQTTTANQATSISGLTTRATASESNITNLQTTTANQATSISGLTTRATASESNITNLQTTTANQATQITTLSTTTGNNTTAISNEATTRANADGTLFAQYSVKVDTNGYVTGFGLSSTAINATPFSEFAIRADRFYIASPSGPGITPIIPFVVNTTAQTVNGVNVPAGVYMDAAFIKNGTITTAKIGNAAITNAQIGSLDATKITTGFISADRIDAGSINASKIDSRGLTIKDGAGDIILSAGNAVTLDRVGNPVNIIPDDGFYSPSFWTNNNAATAFPVGWSASNGTNPHQPVSRYMYIDSNAGNFDYFSKTWSIAAGKPYRVRLWMYMSPEFTGFISPSIHMPGVDWAVPGNTVADPNGLFPPGHTLTSWGGSGWRSLERVYTTSPSYSYMQTRIAGRVSSGYLELYMEVIPVAESFINQGAFSTLNKITTGNVSTFIDAVAIGSAYIADAAIDSAKISNTIQSTNYSATTGWQINKSGTMYLNQANVRGEINVGDYTGYAFPPAGKGGVHISAAGILFGTVHGGGKYFQVTSGIEGLGPAQIITNIPAYIEDLQVNTLKIKNNAVTTMAGLSGNNTQSFTFNAEIGGTLAITLYVASAGENASSADFYLDGVYRFGVQGLSILASISSGGEGGTEYYNYSSSSETQVHLFGVAAGQHTITVVGNGRSYACISLLTLR